MKKSSNNMLVALAAITAFGLGWYAKGLNQYNAISDQSMKIQEAVVSHMPDHESGYEHKDYEFSEVNMSVDFANPLCDKKIKMADDFYAQRSRGLHKAVDIETNKRQTICAAIDGFVEFDDLGGLNRLSIINYGRRIKVDYYDANDDVLKDGEYVTKGQPIFLQKSYHGSGFNLHFALKSIYPNLHFEDPMKYLNDFDHEYLPGFDNVLNREHASNN